MLGEDLQLIFDDWSPQIAGQKSPSIHQVTATKPGHPSYKRGPLVISVFITPSKYKYNTHRPKLL